MRRVDVVFFLLVSQTTCRVTSCQRSVPASSPQSSPLRSTWWRPGTWTHRQASTTAPSTVPGPWWLKRGQRLSTRGKLCLPDRGSMFGFKIPSSPDFFFFFLLQRFVPSFLRLGSWNVVMFVSFEQIKRAMMVTKKNIEAHNWASQLHSGAEDMIWTRGCQREPTNHHFLFESYLTGIPCCDDKTINSREEEQSCAIEDLSSSSSAQAKYGAFVERVFILNSCGKSWDCTLAVNVKKKKGLPHKHEAAGIK